MKETAKRAELSDIPRLAELVREAVAEQVDGRGGRIWSLREARAVPAEESLGEAIADSEHLVLAGRIDDAVVGFAAARVERLRNGEALGVVTDVYVEPLARAVGVGEALLDEVLAWCADRGCVGVDALALPGNRETKNFFETFGFTARALVVHRKLSDQ